MGSYFSTKIPCTNWTVCEHVSDVGYGHKNTNKSGLADTTGAEDDNLVLAHVLFADCTGVRCEVRCVILRRRRRRRWW